ncbi:MAG TPA: cold shock domain-containing protein [Armatimonadota bacterium]|nr:cold shock domain-containing protein [Armatimonadota bacterium]
MRQGTVKWFSDARGYGFVTLDDGAEVFVHYSAIAVDGFKSLAEGQRVELQVESSPKGPIGTRVRPL